MLVAMQGPLALAMVSLGASLVGRLPAAAALVVGPSPMALPSPASAAAPLTLAVDRDDDDEDDVADLDQASCPASPGLVSLGDARAFEGVRERAVTLPPFVRLVVDGKPLPSGAAVPRAFQRLELQGVAPGAGALEVLGRKLELRVLDVLALDGEGREISLATSWASLERTPPEALGVDPRGPTSDPDALRFVLAGPEVALPRGARLVSMAPDGDVLDAVDVELAPVPCPASVAPTQTCKGSVPMRAVIDELDRDHPLAKGRSVRAVLGGALRLVTADEGAVLSTLRVEGPRQSAEGPLRRHRLDLRVDLVRRSPGGKPPVGLDDAQAITVMRAELTRAAMLWGACGIGFGPIDQVPVRVVDPPTSHLLAFGADLGLPATGGVVRLRVEGRDVSVDVPAGARPAEAARLAARAIERAGFVVRVSPNAVIGPGAHPSVDLLVRKRDGALATLEGPKTGALSTDRTLGVAIGRVDFEDGLTHFGDGDSIAGTLEERTLLKGLDDGDPTTIDLVLIPSFGGGGRIGESFIVADDGAIRNTFLLDRAGVRSDRSSSALAHELGHVLLDEPGHPDDFGFDTPTLLMDADASSPTAFGPRRIPAAQCAQVFAQSGPATKSRPAAPIALLRPWPLVPLGRERR